MRVACWTTKLTDTHSKYVILTAFPRQQWFRVRAVVLRSTCIACLVITEKERVYCAVRTQSLSLVQVSFLFDRVRKLFVVVSGFVLWQGPF